MGIGDTLNFVIFDYWNQKIMRVIPLFAPIPVLFLNIKIIDSQLHYSSNVIVVKKTLQFQITVFYFNVF